MKPGKSATILREHPFWLTDAQALTTLWPLGAQRGFYIYGVDDQTARGQHRHHQCHMALSCPLGSVTIYVQTPDEDFSYRLHKDQPWLVLPPTVWRMMYAFSPDAVLVVLASEPYDVQDYIDIPCRPVMPGDPAVG